MDRLHRTDLVEGKNPAEWSLDEAWLSLVRPISFFAPLVTLVLVPTLLVLEICNPMMLRVVNHNLLGYQIVPLRVAFRCQLFYASLVMTPAAYLQCLSSLTRSGKRQLGFVLLLPILLPLSGLVNGYTTRDDSQSDTFSLDWSTFLKVYEGASKSDGTPKSLVK